MLIVVLRREIIFLNNENIINTIYYIGEIKSDIKINYTYKIIVFILNNNEIFIYNFDGTLNKNLKLNKILGNFDITSNENIMVIQTYNSLLFLNLLTLENIEEIILDNFYIKNLQFNEEEDKLFFWKTNMGFYDINTNDITYIENLEIEKDSKTKIGSRDSKIVSCLDKKIKVFNYKNGKTNLIGTLIQKEEIIDFFINGNILIVIPDEDVKIINFYDIKNDINLVKRFVFPISQIDKNRFISISNIFYDKNKNEFIYNATVNDLSSYIGKINIKNESNTELYTSFFISNMAYFPDKLI